MCLRCVETSVSSLWSPWSAKFTFMAHGHLLYLLLFPFSGKQERLGCCLQEQDCWFSFSHHTHGRADTISRDVKRRKPGRVPAWRMKVLFCPWNLNIPRMCQTNALSLSLSRFPKVTTPLFFVHVIVASVFLLCEDDMPSLTIEHDASYFRVVVLVLIQGKG